MLTLFVIFAFFFFNDTATTEIYTLSLHDALPIWQRARRSAASRSSTTSSATTTPTANSAGFHKPPDRKSTRLNSSHSQISYAVFCLKKKKNLEQDARRNSTPHLTFVRCADYILSI